MHCEDRRWLKHGLITLAMVVTLSSACNSQSEGPSQSADISDVASAADGDIIGATDVSTNSVRNTNEDVKSVASTGGHLPLDAALDSAPVAVRGTVLRNFVKPLSKDEIELYNGVGAESDPFLRGRVLFEMEVAHVYRGDLKPGDSITVWIGSALQNDVVAEGSPIDVPQPAAQANVILLAEPASIPAIGEVYIPIAGSGLGAIQGKSYVVEPFDGLDRIEQNLDAIEEALARRPAKPGQP